MCYVFYAMALGAARDFGCVWFLGFVLFWFAWLSGFLCLGGWVGLGLVFWTVVLICGGSWLAVFVVGWGFLFVGFVWRV